MYPTIGQPPHRETAVKTSVQSHDLTLPGVGVRVRVLEAGAGPVVLMLHGNPDNADEWRPLMAQLAATHRCIAPDFPGYGLSPEPPRSFDYGLVSQIRFVDEVLGAMRIDSPLIVVVHDTGGMVGTAWAARNIARVRGIVVTNTVAFEGFRWFRIARTWGERSWLGRQRAALSMWALGLRAGAVFKRIFGAQSPQLGAADLERFATSFALNRTAKRTTLRQFRHFIDPAFFVGFDAMWRALGERVPSRVLWGDDDPYLPVACAQRFGRSTVTVLPGVGHWVPLVAPDRLAAEVHALP